MKPTVYVETTIPSYLTARPSLDLVVAAHQELTMEWWTRRRSYFSLFVSEPVLREASCGDPDAAARRLAELHGIPVLRLTDEARDLAKHFLDASLIPTSAWKTPSTWR